MTKLLTWFHMPASILLEGAEPHSVTRETFPGDDRIVAHRRDGIGSLLS